MHDTYAAVNDVRRCVLSRIGPPHLPDGGARRGHPHVLVVAISMPACPTAERTTNACAFHAASATKRTVKESQPISRIAPASHGGVE